MMILAIDIGGTKTAFALMNGNTIVDRRVIATNGLSWPQFVHELSEQTKDWPFTSVGVATTGRIVDGVMQPLNTQMISFWAGLAIQAEFEQLFRCPVTIINDAAAAALAEFAAIEQAKNLLYVTVSTGVGTGLVLAGELLTSQSGMASHGGHQVHSVSGAPGLPCSCGRTGCIETLASGTAIAALASAQLDTPLTTPEVIARVEQCQVCAAVVDTSVQAISAMITNAVAMLGLDAVVVGGGVGLNPTYFAHLQQALADQPNNFRVPLYSAKLSTDSGLMGAALVAAYNN